MTALASAVAAIACAAGPVYAVCKTPLPDPELRAIDASADDDPVAAIARARRELDAAAPTDGMRRAQLFAIIADAYDTTGDDIAARAAVAGGRAALAEVRSSPDVVALLLRLQLVEADTAEARAEAEAAVAALDAREGALERESLGHVCLLIARGRVQVRIGRYEQAARDGLLAYRISAALAEREAHAEAAYQLSSTYLHAGLYDSALAMIDEVVAQDRTRGKSAALAMSLWKRSQTLQELGRDDDALAAADESRALSASIGDSLGVAFVDHVRCGVLLHKGASDAADLACRAAEQGFRAVQRTDQASLSLALRARIDLARGRPQAALAKLGDALANEGNGIHADAMPRVLRTRADALAKLGRDAEALATLRRVYDLSHDAEVRQRSLAVAVLQVQFDTERAEAARTALEKELRDERAHAENRELVQRLTIGLAVGVALLAGLLARLLWTARRHARVLRQQEAILRQTSENAPDALVLVDPRGATRFANRGPFGGPPPEPGGPFVDAIPDVTRPAIASAIEQLLERREPVALDVRLASSGSERLFDVRGQPIVDDGRLLGATLLFSDVTERRTLERQVLDAAARERRRLGADLHEGLGQELAGIALQLGAAASAARRGRPDAPGMISEAVSQLDRAVASTRDLARGISPIDLARGSLSLALERLAADASRRLGLPVTAVSAPREIVLATEVSDHLYRIAVEALGNAAAHARCARIEIALRETPQEYVLTIEDDGIGLPRDPDRGVGLGIRIMGYRAHLLGATIRFERVGQGGTRVVVAVPRVSMAA